MLNDGTKSGDLWAYVNPQYVKSIAQNGDIWYTDGFYEELAHKIKDEGMTSVQAYAALGFNTHVLSEARAYCAGKRALQRMEKKTPFADNIADFDSGRSFEDMMSRYFNGDLTEKDLYANMAARLIYLEEMYKALKKTITEYKLETEK